MSRKILLVDDDANVLEGYQRHMRGFHLEVAASGPEAVEFLEAEGGVAVLVADMRMPGMTGLELLEITRRRWPHIVRIMLTGNSDQKTAVDAVNDGQVFRFLSKPCSSVEMVNAVEAALQLYEVEQAERALLEKTLNGSLKVLTDLLSLLDPESFRSGQVIRERIRRLGQQLAYPDPWCLEAAAMLAPIGRLTLPAGLAAKGDSGVPLEPREVQLLERVPETGAQMLESIPRLDEVARIIRYQAKRFNGGGFPFDSTAGEDIPFGARILMPLMAFTRMERARRSLTIAWEDLKLHAAWYDPRVLDAIESALMTPGNTHTESTPSRPIPPEILEAGMTLAADLRTVTGKVVIHGGTRLSPPHLMLLRDVSQLLGLESPAFIQSL